MQFIKRILLQKCKIPCKLSAILPVKCNLHESIDIPVEFKPTHFTPKVDFQASGKPDKKYIGRLKCLSNLKCYLKNCKCNFKLTFILKSGIIDSRWYSLHAGSVKIMLTYILCNLTGIYIFQAEGNVLKNGKIDISWSDGMFYIYRGLIN